MANERKYTSRRAAITRGLAEKLAGIDGRGIYHTAVAEVSPRLKFWDEVLFLHSLLQLEFSHM